MFDLRKLDFTLYLYSNFYQKKKLNAYMKMMIIFQEELLQRISRKLEVLRSEDEALKDEMNMNEELGRHVSSLVSTENSNSIIFYR